MLKREGAVQRMDLNLRIKYIGLETDIYQTSECAFVIHCKNYTGDFHKLFEDFDYNIRYIGDRVTVTNTMPNIYIKKIENIPLSNVVNKFRATCITMHDLEIFIKSKFYDVDIIKISTPHKGSDLEILIEVSNKTDIRRLKTMQDDLLKEDLGTDKITVRYVGDYTRYKEKTENKGSQEKLRKEFNFDVMTLSFNKDFPFIITEADFWLSHVEDIYTGKMTRVDLPFYRENSLKCFLDCTVFDNIDIRNSLLLYDTVYIALPIEEHLHRFLELQGMTISELIDLVDIGKLVLLLPNHEDRYNKKILSEVYKQNPLSIVGRRGINTLIAAHLSETKQQYEKHFPKAYSIASDIFMEGVKQEDINLQNIARMIAWPFTATADSFRCLNSSAPMTVSNFGINKLFESFNNNNEKKDAIDFEFMVNAPSTHIATALKATYFPFKQKNEEGALYSDSVVSNMMGNALKSYWYSADDFNNILTTHSQNKNSFLNLFHCKHNVNVIKVAELSDKYKTQEHFSKILSSLDKMNESERNSKLREYNDILLDIGEYQQSRHDTLLKFVLGGTGLLPLNYVASFILSSFGIVGDIFSSTEMMKKRNEIQVIEECIKNNGMVPNKNMAEEIYLLDKISSVATLK